MPNGTWKIARGKGTAQLPLAIVAVLAVVLVLVGKAQSSLFDRARAEFSDWTAPALEAVREPLAGVSRWAGSLGDIFVVYQENLRLKEENARLRQWQSAALMMENRIKRYRLLLNAVPDPALGSVTAHVIGRATRPFLDTMILDAGKKNGVHPGQAVVDPRGMIGRVFLSGERTSWVILLTDLNSRIPVRIVPGNVQAIMAGDNTQAPVLETVSLPAKVHKGDQVVTSGDGGLLPPDLPVGVIVKNDDGLRVALFADPATSDDVRVVDFKTPREESPAATAGDLPAAARPRSGTKTKPPDATTPAVPVPKRPRRASHGARHTAYSPKETRAAAPPPQQTSGQTPLAPGAFGRAAGPAPVTSFGAGGGGPH
jgi:rod shape-determining protein MreC